MYVYLRERVQASTKDRAESRALLMCSFGPLLTVKPFIAIYWDDFLNEANAIGRDCSRTPANQM
jgi:hypothetical protein